MEDKHPIDRLFKDRLGNPDIPFNEEDWNKLQQKMAAPSARRMSRLIWIGSAIAASVVIAAMVFFYKNNLPDSLELEPLAERHLPPLKSEEEQVQQPVEEERERTASTNETLYVQRHPEYSALDEPLTAPHATATKERGDISRIPSPKLSQANLNRVPPGKQALPIHHRDSHASAFLSDAVAAPQHPIERHSRLTLGMAVAPDLSGTTPLNGRLGSTFGLLATYSFHSRLSISSGIWYATKRYQADFAAYRPSAGWPQYRDVPEWVAANCQVLDIPINLHYTVRTANRSSWFLSGGVSSYMMLNEVYDFTYAGNEHLYPQRYEVRGENQHLFGIANIGIGYQRKLSSSLGITVQPFVKVPLRQIGHGNIKLYSTGVAISADIDLSRRPNR